MQSLEGFVLEDDFFGAIKGMHTQPPLLNVIFGLAILVSKFHHILVIQILWLLVAQLGLLFLTLGLRLITNNSILAVLFSSLYVFIPGTLMYSLWSYNTIWVQTFSIMFIVSFLHLKKGTSQVLNFLCVLVSLVVLYLVRVPFNFIFVTAFIILSWIHLDKKLQQIRVVRAATFAAISVILGIQAHYYVNFGLLTTSSWTLDQSLNVLKKGLDSKEKSEIAKVNSCFYSVINNGPWKTIDSYSTCEVQEERIAQSSFFEISRRANPLNSKEHLLGSTAIKDILIYSIPRYLPAYWKVIFGHEQFEGTLYNYLGLKNFSRTFLNVAIYSFIPIYFLFSLILFVCVLALNRKRSLRALQVIVVPLILTLFMNAYSLVGEVVENERIRADSHAVTFFTATLIYVLFLKFWRQIRNISKF